VKQGRHGPDGVTELETPRDVDEDSDHGVKDGKKTFLAQVAANLGTHHFHAPHLEILPGENRCEGVLDGVGEPFQFGGRTGRFDEKLIPLVTEVLDDAVLQVHLLEGLPDLLYRRRFLELQLNESAAGEVDSHGQPAVEDDGENGNHDESQGKGESRFHFTDKIKIRPGFDEFHEKVSCVSV